MPKWYWKRWVGAVLTGAAVAAGSGETARAGDNGPTGSLPKPNETLTLKFQGQPDRKVTVLKSTRKPDGSVETEVKDPKTGETFTLIDSPPDAKPATPAKGTGGVKPPAAPAKADTNTSAKPTDKAVTPAGRESILPRAKARTDDPLTPSATAPAAETPAEKPAERRGFGSRLFGRDRADTPASTPAPGTGGSTTAAPDETGRRPGLLNRIFGPKKSAQADQAAMPANPTATPVPSRQGPAPAVTQPAPVTPGRPAISATGEPPRAMPARPVTPPAAPGRTDPVVPPTPAIPGPPPGPLPVPPPTAGSIPIPTQMPPPGAVPVPVPMSVGPPGVSVPTIPLPAPPVGVPQARGPVYPAVSVRPGGPIEVVLPVGFVPPEFAMLEEIRPYATALRDALAPSARITAAKALAEGRHGSSDQVKAILFRAVQTDPCPEVRAGCIEHLCKLGYYTPAFLSCLKTACTDPSDEVQAAAKTALAKMTPRQQ